ncbi:MAG: hypothetical protein GEU78_16505 [Actinobacteria bacterium]|nr:hypothetical protein [Actinomycetota bacterium]
MSDRPLSGPERTRAATAVRLEDRSRVAELFFHALADFAPSFHLLEDVDGPLPADTDTTVRLPTEVDRYASRRENWEWYKLALGYRALRYHPRRGTFGRPSAEGGDDGDLPAFFPRFGSPAAAKVAFDVVEGARLDAVLRSEFPGLTPALKRAHADEVPELSRKLADAAPRSQLLIALELASVLREPRTVTLSASVARALPRCVGLLGRAVAEGTLSATLRVSRAIYAELVAVPPMDPEAASDAVVLDPLSSVAPAEAIPTPDDASIRSAIAPGGLEGSEQYALVVPTILYRGVIGTREFNHRDTGRFRAAALLALREGVEDDHGHHVHLHDEEEPEDEAEDQPPPEPLEHEHGDIPRWETPFVPPVSVGSANVAWYPEWDVFRRQYLERHCRVIDEAVESTGNSGFARHVIEIHRPTLRRLIREWSLLPREGLAPQRGLADGDELHLETAIQLRIDRRAGAPVNDRIYQRKVPVERDVVVGVLVDLSMSTADHAEQVDDAAPFRIDEQAMALYGKPYRTVLDHGREAAIVLAELMDRLGDQCIVYGFSSTRRHLVRMLKIKGHAETTHGSVASRFETLRPIDATRLGAVIRHGTRRVRHLEARTRFLVIATDGLPYDTDYGDGYPGRELTYALHDTARALDEAEEAGVKARLIIAGTEPVDGAAVATLGDRVDVAPDLADLPLALSSLYMRMRVSPREAARAAQVPVG